MPKIHIRSDTHNEFYSGKPEWHPIPNKAEIIILAGDIDLGTAGIKWASTLKKQILYVAGNHEYYTHNLDILEYDMRATAHNSDNVVFLQNDTYVINDIRFIGTTLWTDYNIFGNSKLAKSYAEYGLSDHRLITRGHAGLRKFFSPSDAQKVHNRSKQW